MGHLLTAALVALFIPGSSYAASSAPHLGFLIQPSSSAAAGVELVRQPLVWALDFHGFPSFKPLKGLTLSAYLDPACSVPAAGTLTGRDFDFFTYFGFGFFEGVGYSGAGTVYLKVSAVGLAAGCSNPIQISPMLPHHLAIVSGDGQSAPVNSLLAVDPQIKVVDAKGKGVMGIKITFTAGNGGGIVGSSTATTDSAGLASTRLALGNTPGSYTLIAQSQAGLLGPGPWSVTFHETATGPLTVALFLKGPSAQTAGGCSQPFTVTSVDQNGIPSNVSQDTQVSVNSLGSAAVFSDSSCGAPLGAVIIAAGSSLKSFYLRDTRAESLSLTASGGGLTASNPLAYGISPGVASSLGFATQPSDQATAGQAFVIQPAIRVLDSYGNAVHTGSASVILSVASDSACVNVASGQMRATTNPVSSLSGTASFTGVSYPTANPVYFKAVADGLSSACSHAVNVGAGGPDHLIVISGDAQSGAVASVLPAPALVQVVDAYNNAVSSAKFTVAVVQGGGSVSSLSATTDATGMASAQITLGQLPGANSYSFKAQEGAWTGTPTQVSFNATALSGVPVALTLSGPATLVAGSCSGAFTLGLVDSYGNVTTASSALSITLTGAGQGAFFADAACGQNVSALGLSAGNSNQLFYFRDLRAEQLSLTTASSGLSSATAAMAVSAGAAANLSIASQPASGAMAGQIFSAQPGLQALDSFGNLAVSAVGSMAIAAYADSSCSVSALGLLSTSANPVAFANGTAAFAGVSYTLSGVFYLGFSAPGLTSACSQAIGVTPAAIDHLILAEGNVQAAVAGAAVAVSPKVRAVDAYGNAVAGVSVSFAVTSGGGSTGPSPVSTDFTGFASSTFILGASPGPNLLNATATLGAGTGTSSSATSVSFSETGTPRPAVRLLLSGDASNGAGSCSNPYNIQALDDQGNNTVVFADTSVLLTGAGSGAFYADSGCTQLVSTRTIAQGSGSNQVYLADRAAEALTLIAQSAGLASSSANVSITAGSAANLVFSTAPSSAAKAGNSFDSQPAVLVQDIFGNQVTGFAGAVTLSAYADVACSVSAGASLLATANPLNASNGQATFAGVGYPLASVIYLQASATSIAPVCSAAITVTSSLELALGSAHTCVLRNGAVQCFGAGINGNLGNGANSNVSTPVQVQGLTSGVSTIGAGGQHTCAALSAGGVQCWGMSYYGELGNGLTSSSNVPVNVVGISGPVQQIVAGDSHVCILQNGGVLCWGGNYEGQLGTGNSADSHVPAPVQGLSAGVVSIAASSISTCALMADGTAYCWGYNDFGQLGNGTTANSNIPVQVQGLTGIKTIAPGAEHTCALVDSGVQCWGHNVYGQLGDGTYNDSLTPVPVQGMGAGVEKLLSGGMNFTCVVTLSGSAMCWGQNNRGQLGDNRNSGLASNLPIQVQGMDSGVQMLKSGFIHACASDSAGLHCWGWGRTGQLGNGGFSESYVPVSVIGY